MSNTLKVTYELEMASWSISYRESSKRHYSVSIHYKDPNSTGGYSEPSKHVVQDFKTYTESVRFLEEKGINL